MGFVILHGGVGSLPEAGGADRGVEAVVNRGLMDDLQPERADVLYAGLYFLAADTDTH